MSVRKRISFISRGEQCKSSLWVLFKISGCLKCIFNLELILFQNISLVSPYQSYNCTSPCVGHYHDWSLGHVLKTVNCIQLNILFWSIYIINCSLILQFKHAFIQSQTFVTMDNCKGDLFVEFSTFYRLFILFHFLFLFYHLSFFPGIDSCLMVTKRDFLEMEASLWLNGRSQNVAKGWLST